MSYYQIKWFSYEQLHLLLILRLNEPDSIKTRSADSFNAFFIKGNPLLQSLQKNLLTVLFYATKFLIILYLLMKHWQKLNEACVLVINNLGCKLFLSLESPTTLEQHFISAPLFIPDFGLLIYELDNFTFKVLYWVILYQNKK